MAFVRTAVDPDAIRHACQVADAIEVTVYDADFPHYEGQQFVEALVKGANGDEHEFNLKDPDWSDLSRVLHEEASNTGETVKFVLDLGTPEVVTMTLDIENHYDGDVIERTVEAVAPPPPAREDEDEWDDWSYTWIYRHTGTGRTEGNSAYFVTVTASSDETLVGEEFEWGL